MPRSNKTLALDSTPSTTVAGRSRKSPLSVTVNLIGYVPGWVLEVDLISNRTCASVPSMNSCRPNSGAIAEIVKLGISSRSVIPTVADDCARLVGNE